MTKQANAKVAKVGPMQMTHAMKTLLKIPYIKCIMNKFNSNKSELKKNVDNIMAAFKTDSDIGKKLENLLIEDKLVQNSYKKFIEILVNLFTYKIKFSLADIINISFVIDSFDSSIRYIAPLLRNLKKINPREKGKPSFKVFDTSFEDKSKKEIKFQEKS